MLDVDFRLRSCCRVVENEPSNVNRWTLTFPAIHGGRVRTSEPASHYGYYPRHRASPALRQYFPEDARRSRRGRVQPAFPAVALLYWCHMLLGAIPRCLEQYLDGDPGRSALTPGLLPFFENTIELLLLPDGWEPDGRLCFQHPEILHGRDTQTLQELARSIVAHLRPSHDNRQACAEYGALSSLVVDAAVDTFDVQHAEIEDVVEFCFDFGVPDATYERLLTRLLYAPQGTSTAQHVGKVLVPVLWQLQETLARRNLGLRTAIQSNVVPKTLSSGAMERLRKNYVQDESQLSTSAVDSLGFKWATLKTGKPHTLMGCWRQVSKVGLWYEKNWTGKRLLGLLGNTETQRETLGQNYDGVIAAIEGVPDARPLWRTWM
ncbi:hypothetical protein B0H17DRAFT_1182629 [Mycena rosella]|uniref:Uncharacterized protein n=1 Tax=Mycena rosella TaxID=1033263 RepID=A0AAD7D3F0_MYCRO|nr:hypothetical protein B0H17DRAFT_1182629 [Mycena rosella]